MRISIVDDDRLAQRLRDRDVAPERLLLHGATVLAGAEEVHAGLADGPHPRVGSEGCDLVVGSIESRTTLAFEDAGSLVGVQCHGRDDIRMLGGSLHRPTRTGQVTADLHDPRHTDGCGLRDSVGHAEPGSAVVTVANVEMAVRVDDRSAQRLGQRRPHSIT